MKRTIATTIHVRPLRKPLGKIGDPSASGFLMDRLRQSLLTVATDPVTPFAIIEALGALGGDGVLAVLESIVTQVKGARPIDRPCWPSRASRSVISGPLPSLAGTPCGFPFRPE